MRGSHISYISISGSAKPTYSFQTQNGRGPRDPSLAAQVSLKWGSPAYTVQLALACPIQGLNPKSLRV